MATVDEPIDMSVNWTKMMNSIPIEAITQEVNTRSGASYSAGGRIDFHIDSPNAILDGTNSYLKMDVLLTGGGTLQGRGSSLIKSIRITSGGVEIQNLREYNLIEEALYRMSVSEDYRKTVGAVDEYDYHNTAKSDLTTARTMCLHLDATILGARKKLPLFLFPAGIDIEIQLVSSLVEVFDGTVTAFTLSNVRFVSELLIYPDEMNRLYLNAMMKAPIPFPYQDYTTDVLNVGSAITSINHVIRPNTQGLKTCWVIPKVQTASTTNWKFLNWRPFGLTQYQFKHSTKMVPTAPVTAATANGYAACYSRMRKSMNLFGDVTKGCSMKLEDYELNTATPGERIITAMAGRAGDTLTLTVASTADMYANQLITFANFDGSEDSRINGKVFTVASVPSATTFTVCAGGVFAESDNDANLALLATTYVVILDSADGTLRNPGSFVIGESFEPASAEREDDALLPTPDKGELRFEAIMSATSPNNVAKEYTFIVHSKKLMQISPAGVNII